MGIKKILPVRAKRTQDRVCIFLSLSTNLIINMCALSLALMMVGQAYAQISYYNPTYSSSYSSSPYTGYFDFTNSSGAQSGYGLFSTGVYYPSSGYGTQNSFYYPGFGGGSSQGFYNSNSSSYSPYTAQSTFYYPSSTGTYSAQTSYYYPGSSYSGSSYSGNSYSGNSYFNNSYTGSSYYNSGYNSGYNSSSPFYQTAGTFYNPSSGSYYTNSGGYVTNSTTNITGNWTGTWVRNFSATGEEVSSRTSSSTMRSSNSTSSTTRTSCSGGGGGGNSAEQIQINFNQTSTAVTGTIQFFENNTIRQVAVSGTLVNNVLDIYGTGTTNGDITDPNIYGLQVTATIEGTSIEGAYTLTNTVTNANVEIGTIAVSR